MVAQKLWRFKLSTKAENQRKPSMLWKTYLGFGGVRGGGGSMFKAWQGPGMRGHLVAASPACPNHGHGRMARNINRDSSLRKRHGSVVKSKA